MTAALRIEIWTFAQGVKAQACNRPVSQNNGQVGHVRRILVFMLLILSLTALVLAVNIPVIRTKDFFFANNEYSVLTAVPALWDASKLLTVFVFVTLIFRPVAACRGSDHHVDRALKTQIRPSPPTLPACYFNIQYAGCILPGALNLYHRGRRTHYDRGKNGGYTCCWFSFSAPI